MRPRIWNYLLSACLLFPVLSHAQTEPNERAFPQSKAAIDKILKSMQPTMSGHLPIVDGFATSATHPLDHYQRAFYQATAEVTPVPSGGSIVRINAKITAWYADPVASRSGYQLLISNGRIESDILDQLAAQLAQNLSDSSTTSASTAQPSSAAKEAPPSAPTPSHQFPQTTGALSSSLHNLASGAPPKDAGSVSSSAVPKKPNPLQAEADSLEELLKNTAHPKNLVAVKKSGIPVVPTPSLTAKPEFLASQHDEFELLDFNADWVHVRISGLSRGWIWRNSVEMPPGIPDNATHAPDANSLAVDSFRVSREQTGQFPGDWPPLHGKSVKIISVQKMDENAKNVGPQERLEFTKFLLDKNLPEIAKKSAGLDGIVLIFDSADGGMVAATTTTLEDWKSGKLSDAALWHKCFFDPPETFDSAASSSGASGAAAER